MTNLPSVDVAAHLDSLRRYARALTRDEAAADDLVQEALLRALERAGTYRPGGSLRAWLAGIVHNRFVSGRRRQAAEARRDQTFADFRDTSVEGDQEHAAQLALVAARFDALPAPQRAALHLVAVEGLSYQEAATALDVPIGTIMSRLSRARAALRAGEARVPTLRMVRGDRDDR